MGRLSMQQLSQGQVRKQVQAASLQQTSIAESQAPDLKRESQASGPSSFGEAPESLWDYLQRMKRKGRLGELVGKELPAVAPKEPDK